MAFTSISNSIIKVGSAIKAELLSIIKNNFDDIDQRINNLESGASKIEVFNILFKNTSLNPSSNGISYFIANQSFNLTNAYIQIFEKGSLTGTFEMDIKKSTTNLDNLSFSSIFTTKPSINFSTASDYAKSTNQVFAPNQTTINEGDILRVDLTAAPTNGLFEKFILLTYGEK